MKIPSSSSSSSSSSSLALSRKLQDTVRDRCRSGNLDIKEALNLFHQMLEADPKPPIYSFNLLFISIKRMKRHLHVPISLFDTMRRVASISPDTFTYGILIDVCSRMNRVDLSFSVFGSILKRGRSVNVPFFNILINGLCEARRVDDAVKLFDEMPQWGCEPGTVTYSTLIKGLCDTGNMSSALDLLHKMRKAAPGGACKPNLITYTTVIRGLCKKGDVDRTRDLLQQMTDDGISPTAVTYNCIIHGLCAKKRVREAAQLLEKMPELGCMPDVYSFSTLIHGLCVAGNTKMALELHQKMKRFGCQPDIVAYNTIIDTLCKHGEMGRARELLQEMVGAGIVPDVITYTTVIHGYCLLDNWKEAIRVFQEMLHHDISPDVATVNLLMNYIYKHGMTDELRKQQPNIISSHAVLDGYCQEGRFEESLMAVDVGLGSLTIGEALDFFHQNVGCRSQESHLLLQPALDFNRPNEAALPLTHLSLSLCDAVSRVDGITPDTFTYGILIGTRTRTDRIDLGFSVFGSALKRGVNMDVPFFNIVIGGLRKPKTVDDAAKLFDEMPHWGCEPERRMCQKPDLFSYTTTMHGLCRKGDVGRTPKWLQQMADDGITPSVVTYDCIIRGLCLKKRVVEAAQLLHKLPELGCKPVVYSFNTLLRGFCIVGDTKLEL
ncbi:uncharacterized protein A4U43_C08F2180 [Asparagus officinalis]|nr:uncharacterized protein A4U43_C08F2180 [Asparagus officinalis]